MNRTIRLLCACSVVATAAVGACRDDRDVVSKEIRATLELPEAPRHLARSRWRLLQQIYADRDYQPLWTAQRGPLDRTRAFIDRLCRAEQEGLRPGAYDLDGLRRALERTYGDDDAPGPATRAALDLRLTALFVDYGTDLVAGRLDPRAVDDGWYIKARRGGLDSTLRNAVRAQDFDEMITPLLPRQPEYHDLMAALAQYRDLPPADSVERRIRQIELNLERYRWLPNSFGDRYILVNIPEYQLYAYDGGKLAFTMRVIVGDEYDNATPVFADSMTHVVFRPHWNVPSRILVDEMLPKLRDDADYLLRNNFEVIHAKHGGAIDPTEIDWEDVDTTKLEFRIRQKPGDGNPLGQVKFMFPNQFSIYLHDTPADELFNRSNRTLSHGCVRVEDPVKLAAFVLAGQDEWDEETIREAMDPKHEAERGTERTVNLTRPIPVYLVYLTAFVDDGAARFRDDPYQKDARAMARLRPARPRDQTLCQTLTALVNRRD